MPVIVITAFYGIVGAYNVTMDSFIHWFVYPTHYHFVASIILLYILYYFIMNTEWLRGRLLLVMSLVMGIWLTIYFFLYDKSYYHIDNVYEPMIRFLFLESMLLGAFFKQNDRLFRNNFRWLDVVGMMCTIVIYFAGKLMFSKKQAIAQFQCLNQILVFGLLYFLFRFFSGMDGKLEKLPKRFKQIIAVISEITLEIYLVQYVLVDKLRTFGVFPFNWVILTTMIIAAAFILRRVCAVFYDAVDSIIAERSGMIK